jgi:hypothetical protein
MKEVALKSRVNFFPRITPKYLELENVIYEFAKRMIKGYSGANLKFFVSEKTWCVADLGTEKVVLKHIEGFFEKELSSMDAWKVVTLFAMNYHLNKYYQVMGDTKASALTDAYYALKDQIIDSGLYEYID